MYKYNFYSLKMFENFQKISKKRANRGKTCFKVPDRKVTRLECVKQNIFKSLVFSENQKTSEFVLLNKKKTFDNFDYKVVDGILILGKKGYSCLLFFILF